MNPGTIAAAVVVSRNRSNENITGGRAYPFSAPPPVPSSYYNPFRGPSTDDQRGQRRDTLLRSLTITIILVIIIMAAMSFIIWVIIRPRVPEFQLDSASVSYFDVSTSNLTANWDLGFTVINPNKKLRAYYDGFFAYMLYGHEDLAETLLPPFDQGTRNQTTLQARFVAASTYVSDNAAKSLAADRGRGAVNFNVKLVSWITFEPGIWRRKRHSMFIHCSFRVSFSSHAGVGTLSGGSRGCDLYL